MLIEIRYENLRCGWSQIEFADKADVEQFYNNNIKAQVYNIIKHYLCIYLQKQLKYSKMIGI